MSKTILITGASRGIGAETARLAAQSGYSLCLNYRNNRQSAEELCASLVGDGHRAITCQADISVESQVVAMYKAIDREFGRLDGLVNNAGILETQSDIVDMSRERWQRILDVNVIGTFLCAREAVKRMSTVNGGHGGSIVNLSSRAADLGAAHEYVDYAASKGAVDALTIGLAKEVGDQGIRVNAVKPGLIYTDIHADSGEAGRESASKLVYQCNVEGYLSRWPKRFYGCFQTLRLIPLVVSSTFPADVSPWQRCTTPHRFHCCR